MRKCFMSPSLNKLVLEKVAEDQEHSRGHCILVEDIVFIETGFSTKLASALARVNKSPMHHAIRITTNKAFIELSTDEKGLRDAWAAALKSLVKASKEFHSAQGFRLYCNLRMTRTAEDAEESKLGKQVETLQKEVVESVMESVLRTVEQVALPDIPKKPSALFPKVVCAWLDFAGLFNLSHVASRHRKLVQSHLTRGDSWEALALYGLDYRSYSWCLYLRLFFARTKFKRSSQHISEESAELIERDVYSGRISKSSETENVLRAVCQQHYDVGYCQGMHLLAEFLFRTLQHEKHVLGAMLVLMNPPYNLAEVFKPGFPKLKLVQYQLQSLVKLKLPNLKVHLKTVDLDLSTITAPWILTLFTNVGNYLDNDAGRRFEESLGLVLGWELELVTFVYVGSAEP